MPDDVTTLSAVEADRVGAVFAEHRQLIEAVARRHCQSTDHAADVVQEVAVLLCRHLASFRAQSRMSTWLYRVTVNAVHDYYRVEQRHGRLAARIEAEPAVLDREAIAVGCAQRRAADLDARLEQQQQRRLITRALPQLTPAQQQVVRHQLRDPSVVSGSKAVRHRARRRLRAIVGPALQVTTRQET